MGHDICKHDDIIGNKLKYVSNLNKEITCTTDQSYPATSIGVNIDAVTEADVPMGKLFTYALSPVDNNKVSSVSLSHRILLRGFIQSLFNMLE